MAARHVMPSLLTRECRPAVIAHARKPALESASHACPSPAFGGAGIEDGCYLARGWCRRLRRSFLQPAHDQRSGQDRSNDGRLLGTRADRPLSRAETTTEMMTETAPTSSENGRCLLCDRPFQARRTGGTPKSSAVQPTATRSTQPLGSGPRNPSRTAVAGGGRETRRGPRWPVARNDGAKFAQ